ncbi:MAG: hypothetical protein ACK5X3_11465, partial [Pseudomonadota bacterium]
MRIATVVEHLDKKGVEADDLVIVTYCLVKVVEAGFYGAPKNTRTAAIVECGGPVSRRFPIAAAQYFRTPGKLSVEILILCTIIPGPIILLRLHGRRPRTGAQQQH